MSNPFAIIPGSFAFKRHEQSISEVEALPLDDFLRETLSRQEIERGLSEKTSRLVERIDPVKTKDENEAKDLIDDLKKTDTFIRKATRYFIGGILVSTLLVATKPRSWDVIWRNLTARP